MFNCLTLLETGAFFFVFARTFNLKCEQTRLPAGRSAPSAGPASWRAAGECIFFPADDADLKARRFRGFKCKIVSFVSTNVQIKMQSDLRDLRGFHLRNLRESAFFSR